MSDTANRDVTSERTDTIVDEFPKNSRETVRVAVGDYKGHALIHVRAWTENTKKPGSLIPTRNGLSLRRELIPRLIEALNKASAA